MSEFKISFRQVKNLREKNSEINLRNILEKLKISEFEKLTCWKKNYIFWLISEINKKKFVSFKSWTFVSRNFLQNTDYRNFPEKKLKLFLTFYIFLGKMFYSKKK